MRFLPTSLTLAGFVGFTVTAGLTGCSSDAPSQTPGGSSGASGSGASAAGSGQVPGAGASGAPVTGTAGSGSGGTPVVGSAGSNTSGGSNSSAGAGTVGGSSAGGAPGAAGGGNPTGGAGADLDAMGKGNAKPGDMTAVKQDYLRMGEIRLINNNWGAAALGCNAPMNVFINADKSFGWNFDRGDCDKNASNSKPDFPQIEFGIHPFGLGSADATSPNFSSTTLLPKQVKDITSASVTLEGLNITLSKEQSWDLTFELWLSKENPATTQGNAGVYAELMTFWGWQDKRWPLTGGDGSGPKCNGECTTISAGTKSYQLVVQDDNWAGGKWRYFQFRGTDGSKKSFDGKVEVKPLLDYLMSRPGYTKDMWLARLEVGSEIDDETKGTVTMKNVIFEVNGQSRSPVFGK